MASFLENGRDLETMSTDSSEIQAPLAYENYEVEIFEDAKAEVYDNETKTDLSKSFADCELAMEHFFNNDITSAMKIMNTGVSTSVYHSLGAAIFQFIPAALTFDEDYVLRATGAIKNCIAVCNRHRKQYSLVESIGSIIKKPNFAAYTDLEAHAELCYAEALLLNAGLHILEGEELTLLIKSSLKIKACYSTYQLCWNIKEYKTWDSEEAKIHFKSGVRLGTAAFNLIISLLPPRIVSLLEFVGFSGNKYYGLTELEKGARCPGLRAILCDMALLAYHLVICHYAGGQGDMYVAMNTLHKCISKYPNSVWFMVFKARYQFIQGDLPESIVIYSEVANSPSFFQQIRHVCFWELMWIYCLRMEFRQAAMCAQKLVEGSSWSKTTHYYIQAVMLMQIDARYRVSSYELGRIQELMREAPAHKKRIAGKSLPMEKFVIKRCARYFAQRSRLVLPAIELLCIWNLLPLIRNNRTLLHNIMKTVERTSEMLDSCEDEWLADHKGDNRALLLYLHGCCLIALNLPLSALAKFSDLMNIRRGIKEDTFLVPYTVCEMGWCHYKLGDMEKAYHHLNDAKKKFSGYAMESRLHFRIHARLQLVRDVVGNTKFAPRP